MALRPVAFSIPSTTELKVTFSENLSESLSSIHFEVESLSGSVRDLEVTGVTIAGSVALIKTRPQVAGNYYLLKFLDATDLNFISNKGSRLLDDSISRELFFVGIDNVNPIRDRIYRRIPDLFELEGSILKNILSAQANELFKAQKDIGSVLSNNYVSETVVDEFRTRSAGAFDRMANENVYEVVRISKKLTGESIKTDTIEFSSDVSAPRMEIMPVYPVPLQQVIIEDEEITVDSEGNSFEGYLLSLAKKNVTKILSVLLIRSDDNEDCDGDIGINYDVERYKYAITSNRYDQDYGFNLHTLESNQILLSEFGNLPRPTIYDTIIVTYAYKDLGRHILIDQIEVSRVEDAISEAVPSSATSFFLDNAPVVNSSNNVATSGALTFSVSENDGTTPDEFVTEITFNASRLPSFPGEWSCDYETGEVFVYGKTINTEGTGRNNYIVDYLYRKEFKEDLDYSISDQDLVATPDRELANKEAEIFIRYDYVFAEGTDYEMSSHIEVMPEFMENRLNTSFSVIPQHTPVTDVFRILNQTTGELYTPMYHSDSEIFFAGNRSPEIKSAEGEKANFQRVRNEELGVIGEFIAPTHTAKITSVASNNSIQFSPGIPSELISQNSNEYYFRELENDEGDYVAEDVQIKFFGDEDSGGLITSVGINVSASPPTRGSTVIIGPRAFVIHLDNEGILNKNSDALGSLVNTSFVATDKDVFENERYFEPILVNPGFSSTTSGGISQALTADKGTDFYSNLERLRVVGDYLVDYRYGIAYVAVGLEQDVNVSTAHYAYATHKTAGKNILTASSVAKKTNGPEDLTLATKVYSNYGHNVFEITIHDIEDGLTLYDGVTEAVDLNDNLAIICEVREDYTVVVPHNILAINSIFKRSDLEGVNLNASDEADRSPGYSAEDLTTATKNGGRNLCDSSFCTFTDNVIDLKKVVEKRAYMNADGDFEFTILDSDANTFVKCVRSSTQLEFFSDELNITKVDDLEVVSVALDGSEVTVYIDSSTSIADVDSDGDFVLDENGSRFTITDVDSFTSIITVASPAVNNVTAILPAVGPVTVVVKPTVTITDTGMTIIIPSDSGIANGEKFEVTYLPDGTPEILSTVAVDYRYGFHYFDYTYLNDEIVVWYEYGDNAIDWSISDALTEGEGYFITYKFGALRQALRANFGSVTDIPFFKNFPVEVNRELYRDALKGTLQAFPKGPTIPAFTELVKAFTDIEPDIDELAFGNWILGRDYVDPADIHYDGVLDFTDGKFDSGLVYNDDVVTSVPAISSLPLNEGTLECWIRPEWSGVANDATLTFDLDNLGRAKFGINAKQSPYDDGFVIYPTDGAVGGTDVTGLGTTIFNFRTDDSQASGFDQSRFGIFKELTTLTQLTPSDLRATMKIDRFGLVMDTLVTDTVPDPAIFRLASLLTLDDKREVGVELALSPVDGFEYLVSTVTMEDEEIPNFDPPYQTRKCKCFLLNTQSDLARINDLEIEIDLGSEFELDNALDDYKVITDDNSVLLVGDSAGYFYEVIKLIDHNDDEVKTIKGDFEKLIVKRIAVNNPSATTNWTDEINGTLPTGTLYLYVKTVLPTINDGDDSSLAFLSDAGFVYDWSDYTEYRVNRRPSENLVDVHIGTAKVTYFYTDFLKVQTDTNDLNGVLFAALDQSVLSEFSVLRHRGHYDNIFNLSDVYIGAAGYSPTVHPFGVNKEDSPDSPLGIPKNIETDEGIFIWFDELCTNPFSDEAGQWVMRVRADRSVLCPDDVIVNGYQDYQNVFISETVTKKVEGDIYTSGDFGSVVRSHRDETLGGCDVGEVCSATFRYCGNELLESNGWYKLEETSSDLINVVLSGTPTDRVEWVKHGDFDTSESKGIYRAGPSAHLFDCVEEESVLGNMLYTKLPCSGGDVEYTVSMKVDTYAAVSGTEVGSFSGFVSGNLTGITPIHMSDGDISVKVSLGFNSIGENLVLVIDGETDDVVDVISYVWDDSLFHEYTIIKTEASGVLNVYVDDILLSQISLSDFSEPSEFDTGSIYSQEFLALHIADADLVDSADLHAIGSNTVDVDLIFFSGSYTEGLPNLESTDIFIHTDDRIQFSFSIDEHDVDGYGYGDAYDGYGDLVSIDEVFISSDRRRYIADSGIKDGDRRFSIFKDGKGFLNFRVYDESLFKGRDSTFFNVSTNIKHFVAGDLHHVAASWKLNSVDEKDEMHLFVDGQEASNIYKFGGKIPVAVNDKFSDVSKESLQNFLVRDIDFCQIFTDGTTVALSSIFTSVSATFAEDMVGRSIIVTGSSLYDTLIGQQLIIASYIDENRVTLATGSNLETVTFVASASDIEFKFAPVAGIRSDIMTDLRNNRFVIKRSDASGDIEELGGILYTVDGTTIDIIQGSNVYEPKFRANIDTRIIEFVGRDEECSYLQTVFPTDLDVHVETLGLNLENCKFIIEVPHSTYSTSGDYTSGLSVLRTRSSEPVSLDDVRITKVILPRTALEILDATEIGDNKFLTTFDVSLDEDTHKVSSESGRVIRSQNLGRLLELRFESDNVNFCDYTLDDGYQDGYQDGTTGTITIYGQTIDGIDEETFFIGRNGSYFGRKYFIEVTSVEGTLEVVDEDYFELGVIEIREANPITTSDNNGDAADILSYRNGAFTFATSGSNGGFPFELHKGYYSVDYPTFLRIGLPQVGDRLYIGSDYEEAQQFGGAIDELRIISEMSSDTRVTERDTNGTRSVTEDFNKSIPFCPDSQTTALLHFNDPIDKQLRKLRSISFLNEEDNYSFNLSRAQIEELLEYVNDGEKFVLKMINMGFDEDNAVKTFYEVHRAEGGPLWDDSKYYRTYAEYISSSSSVNNDFGYSGYFVDGNSLLKLNEAGEFRHKEGTIEFWASPVIDTTVDAERRYFVDVSSASRDRIKSTSSRVIDLPNKAKNIVSVKLISSAKRLETFYTESEKSRILFDEIARSEISGRLEGGTGSDKDFSVGAKLSANGSKVLLAESLPGQKVDVIVTYIPLDSSGDRVSVYKDENGYMTFAITANNVDHIVNKKIDWKKNTWHRVMCTYKTGSNGYDTMKIFVDGEEGGIIRYGEGLIYGTGFIYGQYAQRDGQSKSVEYKIDLNSDLKLIAIGSDIFGDNNIRGRLDNLRFSRVIRPTSRDSAGNYVDLGYSSNINTVRPVVKDDATTYLQDFDADGERIDKFATIIDPENGIFEFDINVFDNFDRVIGVNDGEVEELLVDLVNRLKPAHANAVVRFIKSRC